MTRRRVVGLSLFLVILLSSLTLAAPAPEALSAFDQKVVARIDGKRMIEHIRVLSEDIGYRIAGTEEEFATAQYIAKTMRRNGYDVEIQKFVIGRSYLVQLKEIEPTARDFAPTILTGSELTTESGIAAELVFCGLGKPEEIPAEVAGKIALIERGELTFLEKAQNAAAQGAVGVVIYNNTSGRLSGTMASNPGIPVVGLTRAEGLSLQEEIEEGNAVQMFLVVVDKGDIVSPNVVAYRPPKAAKTNTDEVVIVSAHLDSVGPGANDNASGVALALELARILKSYPIDRELRFIFFGAEERGLLGSKYYVDSLSEPELERIVAVFNFDMVGTCYGDKSILTVWTSQGNRNIVTDTAIAAGARLSSAAVNSRTTRSDHAPFEAVGIPAATFLRLPMEKVYHTPQDTIEENISAERLEDTGIMAGAAVYHLARPAGPALERSAVAKENLRIFVEELDRIIEENLEEYADIYVPRL